MTVRTRFAPSPTGYLHIGGVRTALFCWLFARHHSGRFVLRIDDTDQQRNVEQALQPILDGLRWLGIDWDEGPELGGEFGPYFQSQRTERYREAVERLLASGKAYRDYATPDEIKAEREAAQAEKRSWVYSRRWMAETPEDDTRFQAEGRRAVVRLKMPREGKLVVNDLVRGPVEFEWAGEQDHVIQRNDGSCLYHLASAVDDHEMGITHVIRAEEHLSNTPRQVFILQSLGYAPPQFAHLPFVAEPGSKTKLSKRKLQKYLKNRDFAELVEHGRRIAEKIGHPTDDEVFNPVIVDFYRTVGYLPAALLNYLALLGWSLDDHTEHFTVPALVDHFSLERVNKAPAAFDPKKLMAFQERHMRELPAGEKLAKVLPLLQQAGWIDNPATEGQRSTVEAIIEAAGDRLRTAGDILTFEEFFLPDAQLTYVEKDVNKRLRKDPNTSRRVLLGLREKLAAADSFSAEALESLIHDFAEENELKMGQVVHPVRVAVTGKSVGLGLFETLAILGRHTVLRRIDHTLATYCAAEEA